MQIQKRIMVTRYLFICAIFFLFMSVYLSNLGFLLIGFFLLMLSTRFFTIEKL